MVYCRSLFTVLLSACLLISQASPVYAQTAPVAHEADSVQSIAEETVQVYRSLTDNPVQNSFCSGITLPEEVNPYQFESFCTQWMSQVNAICQKTLKNPDNITELLDPSEGNVAEQCAELQKPEILLEMYKQQEDVLGESTEAQRVYLENLSGTVLAYLKQDEDAMLNALKEASPIEQLDPYTHIFPVFYLIGGLSDADYQLVTEKLRTRILTKGKNCKTDPKNCPLPESLALARIAQSEADAEALASLIKQAHNTEMEVAVLTGVVPGLVSMADDEDSPAPVKQYVALTNVLTDILRDNKGEDTLWSWWDLASVEGWINLVDHAVLRRDRFASGWETGFYDHPEQYQNQLSAWAQVGQLLGHRILQGDASAKKMVDGLISSKLLAKNNALLLGVLAQGVLITNKERTAELVEALASNGMYDLKPNTRAYMWNGLYTTYTEVLGKTKKQAAELGLYPLGSAEFNARLSSERTTEHVVGSFKSMGQLADIGLLFLGVGGVVKGVVSGISKMVRVYQISRSMLKISRAAALGLTFKYGLTSTGRFFGQIGKAVTQKLNRLYYRSAAGIERIQTSIKQARLTIQARFAAAREGTELTEETIAARRVSKNVPGTNADTPHATTPSNQGGETAGTSADTPQAVTGTPRRTSGRPAGTFDDSGIRPALEAAAEEASTAEEGGLTVVRGNRKQEFDTFYTTLKSGGSGHKYVNDFQTWYRDLSRAVGENKTVSSVDDAFLKPVVPGENPEEANLALMYLFKISKDGHFPPKVNNRKFVERVYRILISNPEAWQEGYTNMLRKLLVKMQRLSEKSNSLGSFFKAHWIGGDFTSIEQITKNPATKRWYMPGWEINEEADLPLSLMGKITNGRAESQPLQFAYIFRQGKGPNGEAVEMRILSLQVQGGRHANASLYGPYKTGRISHVTSVLNTIEQEIPGVWRVGAAEFDTFNVNKGWRFHVHRESPVTDKTAVNLRSYTTEIDIHDLVLEDELGNTFASLRNPHQKMTIGDVLEGYSVPLEETDAWRETEKLNAGYRAWQNKAAKYRKANGLQKKDPVPDELWEEFTLEWAEANPQQAPLFRGRTLEDIRQAQQNQYQDKILLCEMRAEELKILQTHIQDVESSMAKMLGPDILRANPDALPTIHRALQGMDFQKPINRLIGENTGRMSLREMQQQALASFD